MLQDVPTPPSGAAMCLPAIAVDQCTQLVPPTIGCLLGLTAIADEVSERWITPRRDREVMRRWLGRVIERNNEGQIARFCIHREAQCGCRGVLLAGSCPAELVGGPAVARDGSGGGVLPGCTGLARHDSGGHGGGGDRRP